MSAQLDNLVEELREPARALIYAASAAGLQPRVTSTLRSNAEQKRLYRRFLANPSGFPAVPPGFSAHEYGEAFDMVVTPMDALADVGYTWQSWGGGWNGSDAVHFELPGASAKAKRIGERDLYDPYLQAQNIVEKFPWYVQLLAPWQLQIYKDYPIIRPLINPNWGIERIGEFFGSLIFK